MAEKLVEIKVNEAEMKRVRRLLASVPGGMKKVMSRAVNKTATHTRAEIIRKTQGKLTLLKKRMLQYMTMRKATYSRWRAVINVSNRRLPLFYFKGKKLKHGFRYEIEKGKPEKYKYTPDNPRFVTTVKNPWADPEKTGSHTGIFGRAAGTHAPMKEDLGPSLAAVLEKHKELINRIKEDTGKNLMQNIRTQVNVLLMQHANRGAV